MFRAARLNSEAASREPRGSNGAQAHALAARVIAAASGEAFLNAWATTKINSTRNITDNIRDEIRKNIKGRGFGIYKKMTEWPRRLCNATLPDKAENHPPFKEFLKLIEERNKLMHFKANDETLTFGDGKKSFGMSDITVLANLSAQTARHDIEAAESLVREIIRIDQESICRGPTGANETVFQAWVHDE